MSKQEDISTVTGYKDKLVGGVKETVGNLLGIEKMEKEGMKQKKKGEAELKAAMAQQRAVGDRERQQRGKGKARGEEEERIDAYVFLKRQAVLSDLERMGGFERQRWRLHHVDPREPDLRKLFVQKGGEKWQQFSLRRWNKEPLLREIRERKTKRPLVHVETKEKGLMFSLRLGKGEFKLKRDERLRPNLMNAIRKFNIGQLKKVNRKDIRDRSAPRLDLLKTLKAIHQQHDVLLREVTAPPRLKHVDTKDKTKPNLYFDKNVHVHRLEKDKLLNEVKKGLGSIKHVETKDKSKPMIEKDMRLKKWDKQGFLAEVRKGTELKHI